MRAARIFKRSFTKHCKGPPPPPPHGASPAIRGPVASPAEPRRAAVRRPLAAAAMPASGTQLCSAADVSGSRLTCASSRWTRSPEPARPRLEERRLSRKVGFVDMRQDVGAGGVLQGERGLEVIARGFDRPPNVRLDAPPPREPVVIVAARSCGAVSPVVGTVAPASRTARTRSRGVPASAKSLSGKVALNSVSRRWIASTRPRLSRAGPRRRGHRSADPAPDRGLRLRPVSGRPCRGLLRRVPTGVRQRAPTRPAPPARAAATAEDFVAC